MRSSTDVSDLSEYKIVFDWPVGLYYAIGDYD